MKFDYKKLLSFFILIPIIFGTMVSMNSTNDSFRINAAQGDIISTFSADEVVTSTGYTSYSNDNWLLTFGGNNKSGGTNSNNRSKMTLGTANVKYAGGTGVSSSASAFAIASKNILSNVGKVTFEYSGGSNATRGNVFLTTSTDGVTYTVVPLTGGTQGATTSSTLINYEFYTISSSNFYAIVVKNTDSSGDFRIDNIFVKFYEGATATGTITVANTHERVQLNDDLIITPTLSGSGTLEASLLDDTIASLTVSATNVTINPLKVGNTTLNLNYGGSVASIAIEVFDSYISVISNTVRLLPEEEKSITATPHDFTPTSYLWTKDDANGIISLVNIDTNTVTITAGTTLGSATLTITASNESISRQQNISVTVANISEGTYTLTSSTTTYTSPITAAQINVDKSINELDNLTISDIGDIRLGASPNTSHISIGGSSTAGGSFKINLPDNLYAVSVKFNGLIVDSGKTPILKINDGVSFKYSSGMTSATLTPYSNSLLIATSPSRIWVSSIEIEAQVASNAALHFGTTLLDATSADCANQNVSAATWTNLQTIYSTMDAEVKTVITSSAVNNNGNDLEKALGRYEYIVNKYAYTDFIEFLGNSQNANSSDLQDSQKVNYGVQTILLVGIFGLTALAGFFYIKKRQLD